MKQLYGWTGKLLFVDLGEMKISLLDTTTYTERFIGGRGIGAKLYWDYFSPQCEALHPDSYLIIMTGPLAGTPAPSGSRWVVCGKSPLLYPEHFVSANLGGFLGAALKHAGYDGLIIRGKASHKVYLYIDNERVELKNAHHLWGHTTSRTMDLLRAELGGDIHILTTGPAGENLTRLATLATDAGGSGSMGFGSVMGSKNLKAIVVRGKGKIPVAHPEGIERIRQRIKQMMGEGFYNLYGTPIALADGEVVKPVHCYGCPQGCWRALHRTKSGVEGIRKCQANFFYILWDKKRHGEVTEVSFHATGLINDYSLCSMDFAGVLVWLEQCFEQGVLSEKDTELPLSTMGSWEFIETAVRKVSYREGFGNILAEGVMRAADMVGKGAKEIALGHFTQTGRGTAYGPKEFSPSALIYATEPRPYTPELHELCGPLTKWALWYTTNGTFTYLSTEVLRKIAKRFWGSEEAVNFSHYEDKALAAVKIQNRQNARETLILCDFAWPLYDDAQAEDHVGDPALESQLFSAVTGWNLDETALNTVGERIFNLYRGILLSEGRRGKEDDVLPDSQFIEREEPTYDVFGMFNPDLFLPAGENEVISVKGKSLSREGFEKMRNEYYNLRGWDRTTGLFKKKKLEELKLPEISERLKDKVCD